MKHLLPRKEQHHMQYSISVTEISHQCKDKGHRHSERFSSPGEAIGPLSTLFSPWHSGQIIHLLTSLQVCILEFFPVILNSSLLSSGRHQNRLFGCILEGAELECAAFTTWFPSIYLAGRCRKQNTIRLTASSVSSCLTAVWADVDSIPYKAYGLKWPLTWLMLKCHFERL